jgi:hypothetical protein
VHVSYLLSPDGRESRRAALEGPVGDQSTIPECVDGSSPLLPPEEAEEFTELGGWAKFEKQLEFLEVGVTSTKLGRSAELKCALIIEP